MSIANKKYFLLLLLGVFATAGTAHGESYVSNPPTTGFAFTRNLSLGIRGNDVVILQQFLISGGFLTTQTPTDYFGPRTTAALRAWQARSGITPAVGFFGPLSRNKMNAAFAHAFESIMMGEIIPLAPAVAGPAKVTATSSSNTSLAPTGSPLRLKIPKINVDASIQNTGLSEGGVMESPENLADVGWFTGNPRPGERGSAIISGHVAQIRGGVITKPGVFANLHTLHAGDTLFVENDRGESLAFVVRESRLYDPATNAGDIFTSEDAGIHLNLITCEGTWDPEKFSYSQRLVIFTDAAP